MAENREALEKSEVAAREEATLAFWKEKEVFEKSLEQTSGGTEFVFYDGPPFATGLPHSGSLLSSVSKDVIPRYKTMRGYFVRRRWGWDTHGLPIENLVEKKLDLKNKKEILSIGIEKFNETARAMVLEYVHDWKRYVERVGRWVDFDNSYKTMDPSFMESVWWALKQIHQKGNLYEGRKVLMYCPHCETPLAKAEIAMDNTYKDITEETATVKFKVKDPAAHQLPENTYLLAWTTTPWTLPGNVALAVHGDMKYGVYDQDNGEYLIAATDLAESLGLTRHVEIRDGGSLVGVEYEPLYEIPKAAAHAGKKWMVLPAEFVTANDGTGIVHTAVIYGEDDYQLGLREGLPMVPLLNANGTYNDDAPEFLRGKYIKKAEADIKADLEQRGLLFAKTLHTHSYPHCYRCGTQLIYNAVSSWFINIQNVKEKMLAENDGINWMPEHLKYGRFQHNLENAPDWTISRNRFWATPLPIWKDAAGNITVIGSLADLQAHMKQSGNRYLALRHGEAQHNLHNIVSADRADNGLTDTGKAQAKAATGALPAKPTRIYASPYLRAQETAQIVAAELGLPTDAIVTDDRLGEFQFGELEGASMDAFLEWRRAAAFDQAMPGGESHLDAVRRFGEFLYEIDGQIEGETILIVTHGIGLQSLGVVSRGLDLARAKEFVLACAYANGTAVELDFTPLPHNRNYELDFHLPYIDEVQLVGEDGQPLTRIPEVVDCWVESGSMPFAEYHYPFENKEEFEKRSPGDFISEYIGQTRAWFYYLHAIGVSIFGRAAFRNVVTTGNVNAADGAKLSKSKKNYTDPYAIFDQYGADAFRYYLMSSVVMQAEDLTFRDDDVKEVHNRLIKMLENVYAFYALYQNDRDVSFEMESAHPLDRWILARLAETMQAATDGFESFDLVQATRPMRGFVEDLSQWYTRRSRERLKGTDAEDKQHALRTLRTIFREFSKTIAPVMPFIAEDLYQKVREEGDAESVHLAAWPEAGKTDDLLVAQMAAVRAFASAGLQLRQKANIKVRQPLASLSIPDALPGELRAILADEVNVKEIKEGTAEVALDTELTPELVREGDIRGFARAVAEARKESELSPRDSVHLMVDEAARELLADAVLPGVSSIDFSSGETLPFSAELSTGTVSFQVLRDAA